MRLGAPIVPLHEHCHCGNPVGKHATNAPYGLNNLCDTCWKSRRADAWATYNRYRRRGSLVPQPCEAEGCTKTAVEGHHIDYGLPLTVVWLCTKHHRQAHKLYEAHVAEERRRLDEDKLRAEQEGQAI